MISINYKDSRIEWANKLEELTMAQYDEVIDIIGNTKQSDIENNIDMIHHFTNIPKNEIEEWDFDDFSLICNNMFGEIPTDIERIYEIEIDGVLYKEKGTDKLNVREINKIEEIFTNESVYKTSNIISYLFKCDLELIKKQKLITFLPTILVYSINFSEYIQKLLKNNEIENSNRDIIIK